uniref:CHAD domain-containing protein n=1 Tax=uncultured prokaryote TaxID=198431 RepID=H5SKC5_9ZZZZ|nr:hypothetical protein HGMM_F41E03C22 [uncultured prokaryote]
MSLGPGIVIRRFRALVGLRSALHVYRTTLQVLGERARETDRRRELLTLWRPCQERLDQLLDTLPAKWAGPLRLFRQEIEDGLLDDPPCLSAIADALDGLDYACEMLWMSDDTDL